MVLLKQGALDSMSFVGAENIYWAKTLTGKIIVSYGTGNNYFYDYIVLQSFSD